MSRLQEIRESLNLTQKELFEKSGISVRTIQRIEAGTEPKGHTLKVLATTLGISENDLLKKNEGTGELNYTLLKLINLSSLLGTIFPPANILLPLLIMFAKKQFNPLAKQIVSVQILMTILSFIIFMTSAFLKNWLALGNEFTLMVMVLLVLANIFVIIRNTAAIDKTKQLYFRLNFSFI
ncbi:DNA-binding protein [Sediminicola sp. YIK13]|uniref:helix-turn-helix domain-containing protein n=1 Tax=Sediminicola sp. YIK13 TaxID=1453352 RepID=UPI00071ED156|nr:helix-turn-helix domain-containing protein [Sediminicola sp. YIK13]ALM08211.1 DNA-binding protein [Sediminicola sp. YIK13]